MNFIKKTLAKVNTRIGFFILLIILFWLKTIYAYFTDFSLGVEGLLQFLLLIANPIATTVLMLGLAFYLKPAKLFYPAIILLDILDTVLLYLNVIYFREFTDFMTVSTMTGYSKVDQGLSGSSIALTSPHDVFYCLDIVVIILLLLFRVIKIDKHQLGAKVAFAIFSIGSLLLTLNVAIADMDRPQLITRTFDRSYIVKYLGLDFFTVYDGIQTHQSNEMRSNATKSEVYKVKDFTDKHYAPANPQMYGSLKGKNVIILHLESFQQFLINKKINGKEVTPFINKIYNSKHTYSFDNFFHQVGQGKTSDAENMLETSTYGLPQGSLFAQLGSDNTFQGAPAIMDQKGYSTAVFHGNVASFWNRNNTYKNLGYQYFFDASYYDTSGDKATGYGLKDKLLFDDSTKYLQHLQQPFYAKYITVTNHFPYDLDSEDSKDNKIKVPDTDDDAVNNYFTTAHYLDQSVKEFYDYLNKTGLAKNTVVMLYGDHYGISNSENSSLAPLIGKNSDDWNGYDNAQLQRVPLMFNSPAINNGYVDHTYGGEIDVLPTLMHLLGMNSKKYIQFGTDLFSSKHDQVVAFRNRDWVSPKYTSISGTIYDTKTGKIIHPNAKLSKKIEKMQRKVNTEISLSDILNQQNLLRFYHPKGFKTVNPSDYNYSNGLSREEKIEKQLGDKSTSLFDENGHKNTEKLYKTDAPEATKPKSKTNRIQITNPDSNKE
ncbi:glycerol phosphate lipoteichoic acid synthase 1 [Fructilactobacillus lindneri DSM 20690 = JCM 11027]|uniref:Glycerol phosphate lipoteichoic acid synthase 1 n=1 Tax=Fructilactobacillus lindneri DSM 20690 = JCM 11027 TaxID=1122148 RepID=A0A0R2K1D6_9LACO|nr:glycerol phosphate lipoteichoic acid synthase 1 [Fructilactobacillus lindneri DSM 20690 = JCM 11027]SJZ99496.1 lipoteichoic acid synthase [Fructilactobacillus lindneri DSM 20690 = JCM 11027]